jgi:hypothetical protein
MIPMACPSCGRRGRVPPDRLNTRMHCKKCDAVFHMDRSGKIVLGDPDEVARGKKPKKVKSKKEKDLIDLGFSGVIASIPKPVRNLLIAVFLVGGLAVAVGPMVRRAIYGNSANSTFDVRTETVAYGFVDEDPGKIQGAAVAGTEDAARQWYDKVRPFLKYKGPRTPENQILSTPLLVDQKGDTALVCLRLYAMTASSLPEVQAVMSGKAKPPKDYLTPGYDSGGSFNLPTAWQIKGNDYYFDGAKSLELVANLAPPKK